MQSLFDFNDYRDYTRAQIAASPHSWGLITKMSEAVGCQRSQFSRVLSGQMHLTLDQAFRLTDFWQLAEAEQTFFMKLVEWARAGDKDYRDRLANQIEKTRRERELQAKSARKERLEFREAEATYYSSWHWTALHILVSIAKYQTTEKIAERLNLPLAFTLSCLNKLSTFGLVELAGGRWHFRGDSSFLPKGSPFLSSHHANWRHRAILAAQAEESEGVHLTIVQSVSTRDIPRIKQLLLKAIEDYHRIAGPSEPEELIAFTCDLFRV